MDRFELRRSDYSLSAEQAELKSVLRDLLAAHCPADAVLRAEPLGYDPGLWAELVRFGATRMALPAALGGDGAGLVDMVLVAEELGRAAAPVPLTDHVVAGRLLAEWSQSRGADSAPSLLADVAWDEPLGFAVSAQASPRGYLVGSGAVARTGIVAANGSLEIWRLRAPRPQALPVTAIPAAWWDAPDERADRGVSSALARVLHDTARAEWKALTAATLLGMVQACLDEAVAFATTRRTRGVSIGALQAISHPLADMAVALVSGRHLLYRAAWLFEHEPGARPDLVPAAYVFAVRTAMHAIETTVHVQGGLGFTSESAVSRYFQRARGLVAVGGGTAGAVGDVLTGLDAIRAEGRVSALR